MRRKLLQLARLAMLLAAALPVLGQAQAAPAASGAAAAAAAPVAPQVAPQDAPQVAPQVAPHAAPQVALDRVVATVDRRVILASDVEQEVAFARLFSGRPAGAGTAAEQSEALERLIVHQLMQPHIRENVAVGPESKQSLDGVARLRESLHASEMEWSDRLRQAGLSEQDVAAKVAEGLTAERFIETRFRPGVVVGPDEVEKYYREKFVPQVTARGAQAPELKAVTGQIEQILTEQKLNELVAFWVRGLRGQARIRSVDPAYPVESTASELEHDPRYLPLRISPPQTVSAVVKPQAAAGAGTPNAPPQQ